MPGDEGHAIADQLASQCYRLIGVAEVIADDQLDALAENATPGIEIRDRKSGAALTRISHSQWLVSACPRQRAGWRRAAQQAPQTDCFSPKYGKLRKSAASRLFWKNV